MSKRSYTDEEFANAVRQSKSWAQVLKLLGRRLTGGNYKTAQMLARNLNLDTSHILGQSWSKGEKRPYKKTWQELCKLNSGANTLELKLRLWEEGVLERKCAKCGCEDWFGSYSHLELHHIDGNPKNHELDNIQILCANCHSLTSNYRGKNIKRRSALSGKAA